MATAVARIADFRRRPARVLPDRFSQFPYSTRLFPTSSAFRLSGFGAGGRCPRDRRAYGRFGGLRVASRHIANHSRGTIGHARPLDFQLTQHSAGNLQRDAIEYTVAAAEALSVGPDFN
jgi:hypothetical protein